MRESLGDVQPGAEIRAGLCRHRLPAPAVVRKSFGLCDNSGWVGLHLCSEELCLEDLVAAPP